MSMIKEVVDRMQRGGHGNITPTKQGQYCIEWTERTSPDPYDYISCKYMVTHPHDIAEITTHLTNIAARNKLMTGKAD